jgi:hypothetical protein
MESWLCQLSELRDYLDHVPWVNAGTACSKRDVSTLAEAYTLYAAFLVDMDLLALSSAIKFVKRLATVDVTEVAKAAKALDKSVVLFYTTDFQDLRGTFKQCHLGKWYIRPFWRILNRLLLEPSEYVHFTQLHQALSFLSRLCLVDTDEEQDVESFFNRNEAASCGINSSVPEELSKILAEWLKSCEKPDFGHHGTGSTADAGRCDPLIKQSFIGYDMMIRHAYLQCGYTIENYVPHSAHLHGPGMRFVTLMTVPKTALKRRCIALETVEMQYFQQAVKDVLYAHIDKKLKMIPIFHQEQNRRYAVDGSISGKISTIDLSAASDSVRWSLVKRAFAGIPWLRAWLYASRSRWIQYAGRIRRLNIFATMGSAVCFPIESLIFASVCEFVYRKSGRKPNRHGYCSGYSVYGDDIACQTTLAPEICRVLVELGFEPNVDKTCMNNAPFCYRESCGVEAIGGVDVTPVKLPRNFRRLDKAHHPETFETYTQLANKLLSAGCLLTRAFLVRQLLRSRPYPIFGEGISLLNTLGFATNYRCKTRFNRDLFVRQAKGAQLHVVEYSCKKCRIRRLFGRGKCCYCSHSPNYDVEASDMLRYHMSWCKSRTQSIKEDYRKRGIPFEDYTSTDGAAYALRERWVTLWG